MVGIGGKWGSWLDSLSVTCRKVRLDGTLGNVFVLGRTGGLGGSHIGNPGCPANEVVNSAWFATGTYVNEVTILCGTWSPSTFRVALASTTDRRDGAVGVDQAFTSRSRVECPTDGRPGKGFRGRSGIYVDSIALVCDAIVLTTTLKRIVRFKGGVALSMTSTGSRIPVAITVTLVATDGQGRTTTQSFFVIAS